MHLPTRASTLYGFRILQLAVAIPFLVLICWCGVHRAWWNNINGTLGIGGKFHLAVFYPGGPCRLISSRIHMLT